MVYNSLLFSVTQVLAELKEYATEVDVDFVRKAVRAIGRCAIKVEVGNAPVPDLCTEVLSCALQHNSLNSLQICNIILQVTIALSNRMQLHTERD